MRHLIVLMATAALLLTGCGDDDSSTDSTATDSTDAATTDADTTADEAAAAAGDLADDLEETQAAQGGGSATFTVGDETWEFDSVLCAFGEEEIGQEGAEFVLSSIQDGLQMYASIDTAGHLVSLDDIEDFENPSVSWSVEFGSEGVIVVDGKNVIAEAEFLDGTTDDFTTTTPGTFTATCP